MSKSMFYFFASAELQVQSEDGHWVFSHSVSVQPTCSGLL